MANYLDQFQSIKSTFKQLVIAVEDVTELWPEVRDSFQERIPFKNVCLNNKARNPVTVENLPAEFILTSDSRLRNQYLQEQSFFWFHEPYATVLLVTCEDLDEYKGIVKSQLKLVVQADENEWIIVFVNKADPNDDLATKLAKKVYNKIEVEFNSKKRERCCKLDIHGPEANFWEDLESKIMECIRNTLDKRILFYEDEIRKLSDQRLMPVLNFCYFFILKESLAFMFDVAHLHEDALREYVELELCYLESVNGKERDFGGKDKGDDQAALLKPDSKPLTEIIQDESLREFEFRQYLFACQAKLLFKLNRSFEVASSGYSFIITFSKALEVHESMLPFCMCEVWVLTACLALVNATTSHFQDGTVEVDIQKEFYRLQGDLYSLSRIKFMRLAYLLGYGPEIERSPANSAALSILPWPKPANWPLVPPDASSEVIEKEKLILQATPRAKHLGIQRKFLPIEPSKLLSEANRRRASQSVGNMLEMFGFDEDVSVDSHPQKANAASMSRTFSIPANLEAAADRPMRLAEIHVAAEHALQKIISSPELWNSLSSVKHFGKKYLELTEGAAENYHRSWRKRYGVTLDSEVAAVCHKRGNFDQAARFYEKVCALYASEGWEDLLAEVLPNLAECQKKLNDEAGYLQSCVRLLSLDRCLYSTKECQAFQEELVRIAHSEMKNPVHLDVSSLITFSGNPGKPLELCDGDPGTLSVNIWNGFPDDITLESLSLTLIDTQHADESAKVASSFDATVLKPGRNVVSLSVPPQKPGAYVLGVLTGRIGELRFRSHSFSKGSPADIDDFLSSEKPTGHILKVFRPRALVDLTPAVSSALLINEPQWIGVVVMPINYSLKGGVLNIDTGPGLKIAESHVVEIEKYSDQTPSTNSTSVTHSSENAKGDFHEKETVPSSNMEESRASETKSPGNQAPNIGKIKQLTLKDGQVMLPDWASDLTSILWIPVCAIGDRISKAASQRWSIVEGLRTMALKLDFGISHNQMFDSTLAIHFTDPFNISTCIIDIRSGTFLLQITLHSQVKAILSIHDAWLDLQEGFVHAYQNRRRPTSAFFPITVSTSSRAGMLFSICLGAATSDGEATKPIPESILNIRYGIAGNRNNGAHTPISLDGSTAGDAKKDLSFKISFTLQKPVSDPCLAVGFLPLPYNGLRVGQLVTFNWRIERLKDFQQNKTPQSNEEVLYEVDASSESWIIAGRKRGHVSLSVKKGTRILVSVLCVPLVAGYVQPPHLGLPDVEEINIRCNPPAPHLVCVLPPDLCSSYCVSA